MNDLLSADLDSELHSSDLDSELIATQENQEQEDQVLNTVNEYLQSEAFKMKLEELLQKAIQKIVPDIAERLVQDEIKRLTE